MVFHSALFSIALIAYGAGLALIGFGRVLFPSHSRVTVWLQPMGLAGALSIAALGDGAAVPIVLLVALGHFGIARFHRRISWSELGRVLWRFGRSAAVRGAAVGTLGLILAFVGGARVDRGVDVLQFEDLAHFEEMVAMPPVADAPAAFGRTDCGGRVPLLAPAEERDALQLRTLERSILENQHWSEALIRRRPPADHTNCFGWIFTAGRYWIRSDDVERIIDENDYDAVDIPRTGDLVVYRKDDGEACHAALVRAIGDDGVPLVEGKWGWMGVYLHRVSDSCYGQNVIYYRSSRTGHLLDIEPSMALGN